MSPDEWAKEMVGIRKMIGQFANIDPCEVKGNQEKINSFKTYNYFRNKSTFLTGRRRPNV